MSSLSVYPGQRVLLSLNLLDFFLNEVEAVITSDTSNKSRNNITVGPSGFWYYIDEYGADVYARGDSGDVVVSVYTASNLVSTNFSITINDCPVGFNYNTATQTCVCDDIFDDGRVEGVACDQRNIQLNVSNAKWMGCENEENCTTSELIVLDCYFQYCDQTMPVHIFEQSNQSSQCAHGLHRTGIMCGKCKEGFSLLYGYNQCGKCSNRDLGVFLLVGFLAGLFLFVVISLLGITIDKGWTNMVILFSNIVFPYASYDNSPIRYLFFPARLVNLEFGVDVCAYHEIDTIGGIGLSLLFPAYMYFLMLIFAILCRRFSFFNQYFSPSKILVTLTFLLYVRIFKTCVTILAPIYVEMLDGSTNRPIRWLEDPNVLYFRGWHALLGVISIVVFFVYVIWFPLVLLSPSLAYKYGKRFKPFLDAIWAPYRQKFRIWASIRLVLRVLVVMIPRFGINTLFRGISFNAGLVAVFLYLQAIIQPFNDPLINIFDSLLILNVLFLHQAAYFRIPNGRPTNVFQGHNFDVIYLSFFLGLSYIVIVATFVWYGRKSYWLKLLVKCCGRLKCRRRVPFDIRKKPSIQKRPTHTSISIVDSEAEYSRPRYRNFAQARESLLEEEERSLRFMSS